MPRSASRLIIEGRVQGVSYRWWAVRTARGLGLSGWVRNRSDGSVEALAVGATGTIQRFVEACRQGPPHADVRAVTVTSADDDGSASFEQRATL